MATEREIAESIAKSLGVTLAPEEDKNKAVIDNTELNPDGTPKVKSNDGEGELNDTGSKEATEAAAAAASAAAAAAAKIIIPADINDKTKVDQAGVTSKNNEGKTEASKNTADIFANDQVAKLNEYVKNGGDIDDFIRTQRTDYSKISDLEALRQAERLADNTLTEEDITLLLEDKYGVASDAPANAKRLKEIQIKRDASVAKQQLIENQKKWAVASTGKSAEDIEADGIKWKSSLETTASKVEKLDIKLNETDTFSYTVPAETRGKVTKENESLSTFFQRYVNADGTENVEKFVKDMVILSNFEEIVKAAAGFNKSRGKEEIIKDIKNTDFQSKDKNTGSTTVKTVAQQVAEQMFGKR